jgi:dTDP-4-dehydrorhamnose 3,5-epimerase
MIKKISKILKLKIFYPQVFEDKRGKYIETYNDKNYKKLILNKGFIEHDVCISKKNVLRGIHGDEKTWKLVSCLQGECDAYIVNCNKKSKSFGQWEKFTLNSKKYFELLLPPKFGNSFFVKSKSAVYYYKQSRYYSGSNSQFTYNIKDPYFSIKLPNKKFIISERDKNCPFI